MHVDRLAEQLLCAGLIGSDAKFPTPAPSALVESIATLARLHGVEPLLHRCAVKAKSLLLWPQALLEQFAQTTRAQAVTEVLWQREIRQLLDALDSAGVPALLLKGAPLAYTHYEAPYLRPRGDTDVLIPVDQRAAAHGVLLDCGYTAAISPASSFASYQL
ncbi:nucleotidyltransferase family protein, partial [Thiohalocapsa sp.]|uniref:nucleotidyltransferase family protein n=1 Tax=Thiohalocapsa sp. TaxID=2497641 RepID=UPI0025F80C64